jgi:multidrug resistance efflux pump
MMVLIGVLVVAGFAAIVLFFIAEVVTESRKREAAALGNADTNYARLQEAEAEVARLEADLNDEAKLHSQTMASGITWQKRAEEAEAQLHQLRAAYLDVLERVSTVKEQLAAVTKERDAAWEALRPFANRGVPISDGGPQSDHVLVATADCRRARALVGRIQSGDHRTPGASP